ncbi:peptidylprolyl isomerase [Mesonia ostreae]|uniref:Peptidylprolyl isomerase n=1 Tax=Mesonia ostreae TaxID=861110 RepID=A0ABU2KK39_9FLAO|nr:peptidylprolyl isomerase [Mesonia ostreae]MDT0295087.1 peptidylprolyl isomerase [Mesonia ostreae]
MKYIIKICCIALFSITAVQAQKTEIDSSLVVTGDKEVINEVQKTDTIKAFTRFKADGVAAVIGDYLILETDIVKMREDVKNQGMDANEISNCQLAGRLMENKLYAHHAVQDSTINVSEDEINNMIDQQMDRMVQQIGSMEKLLEFYRKENERDLKAELFVFNKERTLSDRMQSKIVSEIEVTPEEVRQFFDRIPEDERPQFGDEVEISQLIIEPNVPQEEEQKVVDQLTEMRNDIVENGASFATKAVLYSQDATSTKGGQMTITRKDPLDKDFKQIAFSLQEGEVSKPFKSSFGYHIIQLDKVRGQKLDIRHIIIMPKVTEETIKIAREKLDTIRTSIVNNKISFDEAARRYSDEEETRGDGGKLINPKTGDTRFELTDIDPLIYEKVNSLEEGEVSLILIDQTRTGSKFFKIITVNKKYKAHIADYSQDYTKIKELALREKQIKAIEKWQKAKIGDTYVKVGDEYKDCAFSGNWLKQ